MTINRRKSKLDLFHEELEKIGLIPGTVKFKQTKIIYRLGTTIIIDRVNLNVYDLDDNTRQPVDILRELETNTYNFNEGK